MNNSNNSVQSSQSNYSFDLKSTIKDVRRRWHTIVLTGVVVAMLFFVYATETYSPLYSTSITLLVQSKTTSTTANANVEETGRIATILQNVLTSAQLQKSAAESIGYKSFMGTLNCSVIEETNIMTITITADSPIKSYNLLQAVLQEYPTFTQLVLSSIVLQTLESPVVASYPINSSGSAGMMVLGFFAGVLLATALFVVLSYFKDTIKKESEIEKKLNTTKIVSIPTQKKNLSFQEKMRGVKKSLSLANPAMGFAFRESFKKFRRFVVSDSKNNERKIYSVTSSLENEGKTTIAVNLALALGKTGYKVLLLDGDMRKPAVEKFLELKLPENGTLTDFLKGDARLLDVMMYDENLRVTIIGCHSGTARANELVNSDKMKYLLETARENFDYVVIDTPPLGFVSDAEDIISDSDAAILVVRRDIANAMTVNDSIDIILETTTELLGCVYNDAESIPLTGGALYGGYGYGYGYGYSYNGSKYGYGKYGKYGYGKYGKYGYGKYGYGSYAEKADESIEGKTQGK